MRLDKYKLALSEIKEKVIVATQQKVNLKQVVNDGSYIYDYKFNKAKYLADRIKRSAGELVAEIGRVHKSNKNKRLEEGLTKIMVNTKFIVESYLEPAKVLPIIEQIEREMKELEKVMELEKEISDFEKEAAARPIEKLVPSGNAGGSVALNFSLPDMPDEIGEHISADVEELQKCYAAGCYRSAIILCGRVIETALHRKYYEITGKDALEKEPGIGIGKLVARMAEKGVRLDPALPQQIHFVNQVRIFS
ncbi:hypothetical protein KY362_06010, partial [Candidatus Woesearchaeota archaeon]|nr:hypothetical protein [Candidatus Woesearchaeota archaeon]